VVAWRATQRRRLPRHSQPVAAAGSDSSSPLAASFRALLHACGGTSEECYVQGVLQVGPARRLLKAASAAGAGPLASLPPNLLAALGVAASQALGTEPCTLPWVGSPGEGGDGVAGAARRLIDHYIHGVATPLPRLLDAGLLLMAFSMTEQPPSDDGGAVALAVCDSLTSAMAGGRPQPGLGAVGPAVTRLLSTAPPKSEYAQRAEQQEEFRALAAVKAAQSEKNALAAERRRLVRGDWKCPKCGTVNFPDRRVCYMCFEEQPEAAPKAKPVATKPVAPKAGPRGGAGAGKSVGQQRPQGRTSRPR
jgi:hypothetical protein